MVWVSLSTILRLSDRMHHILFLLVDLNERSESIRFVKDLDLLDLSDLNLLDLYQIYRLYNLSDSCIRSIRSMDVCSYKHSNRSVLFQSDRSVFVFF